MSLEFSKVVEQVRQMGAYLSDRDVNNADRLAYALELFQAHACDMDGLNERIRMVRDSAISGYRGATPMPGDAPETLCYVWPPPPAPEQAALIAADGSQVYPDPHAPAMYYLVNIAVFTYFYQPGGMGRVPLQQTAPELVYYDEGLLDEDRRLVTNQTVNARRTVAEVQALAKQAWGLAHVEMLGATGQPIIALHDGGLLKFFGANEISGAGDLERAYFAALQMLYDTPSIIAGYVDRPRSTNLISLLHLMSLPPGEVNDAVLKTNGILEGLTDLQLFERILAGGERSAIMTQNSPQNKTYKDLHGDEFEIGFFYINVGDTWQPVIARVELPLWVARDEQAVNLLHGALVAQAAIQGRKRYPYALTRADELAVVRGTEKAQLDELIRVALRTHQLEPEASNKLQTKGLARAGKRQHKLG